MLDLYPDLLVVVPGECGSSCPTGGMVMGTVFRPVLVEELLRYLAPGLGDGSGLTWSAACVVGVAAGDVAA